MYLCNQGHMHKSAFSAVTGNCRFCKANDQRRIARATIRANKMKEQHEKENATA